MSEEKSDELLAEEFFFKGANILYKVNPHLKKTDKSHEQLKQDLVKAQKESYAFFEKAVQLQPENANYLKAAGSAAIQVKHFNKAISYLEQTLPLHITKHGKDDYRVYSIYDSLTDAWEAKGNIKKAISYMELSLENEKQYLKLYPLDIIFVAGRHRRLGLMLKDTGAYHQAIKHLESALLFFKRYGENDSRFKELKNHLNQAKAKIQPNN